MSAVANGERRISRLIAASVFPAAARPTICRSAGSSMAWASFCTLKLISDEGKRVRIRVHS